MALYHPDEERFTDENGHPGRFIAPMRDPKAIYDSAWKNGAPFRSFTIEKGDVSYLESVGYAGRPASEIPSRAMCVYDEQSKTRIKGVPYKGSFVFTPTVYKLVEGARDFVDITRDWVVCAQWNCHLPAGYGGGRSPPFALMVGLVKNVGRVLRVEGRTTPAIGAPSTSFVVHEEPFENLRLRQVQITLLDSDGKDGGFIEAKIGGASAPVSRYDGPTGHAGSSQAYFSYGAYGSPWCPGNEIFNTTFSSVVEGRV